MAINSYSACSRSSAEAGGCHTSALDTTVNTVARTRQRLVEQGFEAALTHKHSPASARPRIFDGVAEAKLFALASSRIARRFILRQP